MSLLGSINPSNLVQTATTVASLSNPVAFAARSVVAQIGFSAVTQLGQSFGFGGSQLSLLQSTFGSSFGGAHQYGSLSGAVSDLADQLNISRQEAADQNQELQQTLDRMVSRMADGDDAKSARSSGKGGGGQSWLMALAEALGKKLDKMANEMSDMADQITDKTPSLTAKFGAKSQEFGILMNAATNAIKSIGEAEANSARKG